MNTEFDESISFSHFFSVYKEFESDEENTVLIQVLVDSEDIRS